MKKSILLCCMVLVACTSFEGQEAFDRSGLLRNIQDNLLLPQYQQTKLAFLELQKSTQDFSALPSGGNYLALQDKWKHAFLEWKQAEVYNFGPIDQLGWTTSFDNWPTNSNAIELLLQTYDGSPGFVEGLGSNKKGLPAMEYLIFQPGAFELLQEENRRVLLVAYSNDLVDKIELVLQAWSKHGSFVKRIDNAADASMTLLANELVFLAEVLKNEKLGVPMGVLHNKAIAPQLVEVPYASMSLSGLSGNVTAMKNVFTGQNGLGLDDYLDALHVKDANGLLSEKIIIKMESILSLLKGMGPSLQTALISDYTTLELLYEEINQLLVLLKTDMMSQLGLLVVFNDNDGD